MDNKRELNDTNIQLFFLIISIVTVIVSTLLTYNGKLKLENKRTIFPENTAIELAKINRVLILIILIIFLLINIDFYKIAKEKKENLFPFYLQVFSSILSVISGIILVYITFNDEENDILNMENPNI